MTLLESLVTVTIVSIVMMIATPSLIRARESYVLNATAQQVASQMRSARIKAVSRNQDCRVRVTSDISYVVECRDSTWLVDETAIVPRGYRITANAAPQFHKRGNVSPSATFTVWDGHDHMKQVVVNINGRVRVD